MFVTWVLACGVSFGNFWPSIIELFIYIIGMLIVGVMLRNIPKVDIIGESIDNKWSGALRYYKYLYRRLLVILTFLVSVWDITCTCIPVILNHIQMSS